MKTEKWIVVIILLSGISFISCSDDDKNGQTCLEGTWAVVYSEGYVMEDGTKVHEWNGEDEDEYPTTFKSNGMMRVWYIDEWIEDRYTYKNEKIYLENYILVFNVLRLTQTELTLELKHTEDNYVLYEKQTYKRIN